MTTTGTTGAIEAAGYDPSFLGVDVPLPTRAARADDLLELAYTHFTVVLDTRRRLAATTAVNVDGAALVDLERADDWFLDPRVPPGGQAGPELYADNDLDRGHLVRRRDPVWGPREVAARANVDSFAYPNAAPQAAGFNQGMELWLGLEDHVLGYAGATRQRVSVVTGPVLAEDDPTYRGVQVPRRFYKVVAWATAPSTGSPTGPEEAPAVLASAAFVLDQSPLLDLERVRREGDVPPLGPFRTFQVPVLDVAGLTGLDLGPLPDADVAPAPAGGRRGVVDETVWRPPGTLSEVRLGA